jgi:signal transduction histidine kinase
LSSEVVDSWESVPPDQRRRVSIVDTEEHWPFEAAIRTRRPVYVSDCTRIIEGFEQFEPFTGDRFPTAAVVLPLARDAEEGFPNVVCVLGLSRPHVPFSADAEGFIHNLRIQMASFLNRTMSQRTDQSIIQQLSNSDKEIMAPVGLLSGLLDDLKRELGQGSAAEDLCKLARRNVARLRQQVGMLVEVSQMQHDPSKASFTHVNFGAFTRDISSMFAKPLQSTGGTLEIDCDTTTVAPVYVDRDSWEKVVVTVLRLATKYHHNGYAQPPPHCERLS